MYTLFKGSVEYSAIDFITVISSVLMTIAAIFAAIAAWQAKNEYIRKIAFEDYLKLSEIIDSSMAKLRFLPVEVMDWSNREKYSNDISKDINEMIRLSQRIAKTNQKSLQKKEFQYLYNVITEITRFHSQLMQEACPYDALKNAHLEYLENVAALSPKVTIEKILADVIRKNKKQ